MIQGRVGELFCRLLPSGVNELIVKHLLRANADVNLHCEGDFCDVRSSEVNLVQAIG